MSFRNNIWIIILFCSFTDKRDCIRDWNYDQLHVREEGHNSGDEVWAYLDNCNLPEGNPWCGCYVLTGYVACGVRNLPSCPAYVPCWFQSDVIWERGGGMDNPQRGDVAGFYFPELSRLAHVGIIMIWDTRNGVTLIQSGNTGNFSGREGDGVYMKIYSIGQIHSVTDKITKGSEQFKYHIVQKKENLYRIALMHSIQVNELLALNNMSSNEIRIGQRLRVQ